MKKIVVSSVTLFWLLGLAPGGAGAFQEEGTLRIGGMWALSGPAAYIGSSSKGLSALAVDEINEAGGVMVQGKRVKIVQSVYDDACKAEEGLTVVRRLADSDKVLFSLGPTCSVWRSRCSGFSRSGSATPPTPDCSFCSSPTPRSSSVWPRSHRGPSAMWGTSPPCSTSPSSS